jgi:hypothetical protein
MASRVVVDTVAGYEVVGLENDWIKALILPGKGADLLEFIWKPLNLNCLLKAGTVESLAGLDLRRARLASHRDRSLGGWMDVLPHLGEYRGIEFTEDTGGIAATLPWDWEPLAGEGGAGIRCVVELPLLPLRIEKTFSIAKEGRALDMRERLTLTGNADARFTWVQHLMFAGDFVNDTTVIDLPTGTVFNAWEQQRNPGVDPDTFLYPLDKVRFSHRGGPFDLRRPLPPYYDGWEFLVFTGIQDPRAALRRDDLGLSLNLRWDLDCFPYLRSLYHTHRRGVTLGLEPGDSRYALWRDSLARGTYTAMKAGETRETWVSLEYGTTPSGTEGTTTGRPPPAG